MSVYLQKKSHAQMIEDLLFRVAVLEVKVKKLEEKGK